MKTDTSHQYTIRNVPERVNTILRQRARDTQKSFNQVALEALIAGVGESVKPKRDFTDIAGGLPADQAATIEQEILRQRQIEPELWR